MKTFKAVVTLKDGKFGFFGNRRVYGGEILDVTDAEFSTRWMKRVRKERQQPKTDKPAIKVPMLAEGGLL